MSTLFGIFDDPIAARRAVDQLRASPLQLDDVSIVTRATASGAAVANDEDVSAAEGAAVGAVWGGLVGLAALLIPGIGPFIALGALGAALTGAVTGAVVGGITAALVDFSGIPEEEARGYENLVREGKTLVAVKGRAEDMPEVRNILNTAGASNIEGELPSYTGATGSITGTSSPVHVAMYDENGRRVDQEVEYGATPSTTTGARGSYDTPNTGSYTPAPSTTPPTTTEMKTNSLSARGVYDTPDTSSSMGEPSDVQTRPSDRETRSGESSTWTSGEFVGEGQGSGPRSDTGAYDDEQWVGEGQGEPGSPPRRNPNASALDDTTR